MCGRTLYFYEEDLPWTASPAGQESAPLAVATAPAAAPTLAPTSPPPETAAPSEDQGTAARYPRQTSGPAQLVVAHMPTLGKFEKASSGKWDYVCKYQTSVTALGTGVTILKFWTSYWEGGRWQDSAEKFSGADFIESYFCPRAYIAASQTCTDPRNWNAINTLQTVRIKWIYYGVDDNRNKVQGEAMIECRP